MSLGETYVTVVGWVGSDPEFKELGQSALATFRVGSTPRQFDKNLNMYVDKPTTWFSVECWRVLAQNAFDSVRIGQPVIVTGKLRTHTWTDDSGESRSRVVLEAFSLGHDLNRGTTTFSRNPRRATATADSVDDSFATHSDTEPAAAFATVPASCPEEASTSPYPADEYSATALPLTPTSPAQEAA